MRFTHTPGRIHSHTPTQVLNQTSAWWMSHTTHIVKNALLSTPDPNVSVMKKCTVFPVEFVCRGFMTGSTDTSLWTHYKAGERWGAAF